jgi:hypothetical protein
MGLLKIGEMEETANGHQRAVSNLNIHRMPPCSTRAAPYMWGARGEKTGSGLREEVGSTDHAPRDETANTGTLVASSKSIRPYQ